MTGGVCPGECAPAGAGSEREGFAAAWAPWTSLHRRLSPKLQVDVRANADYRVHDDDESRDGWRLAADPGLRYTLDSRSTLQAGVHLEAVEARAGHRSSRLVGLSAGISRAFRRLSVSLSASGQLRGYRGQEPLFGTTRRDKTAWLSAKVWHCGLQIAGFAPSLGYSYERNHSNIALYSYQNHGLAMGLNRRF